jgi:hypothetical protein
MLVQSCVGFCVDTVRQSIESIGRTHFVPLHTTLIALLSRLVIFFREFFPALSRAYKLLFKLAAVPILSILRKQVRAKQNNFLSYELLCNALVCTNFVI